METNNGSHQANDNISQDTRTNDYDQSNDRPTFMTELEKVQDNLEKYGYTEQFRVEKGRLVGTNNKKKYKPAEVSAVNFYRFEGISDPDDMSILYAIETSDGTKGTLTDAYGRYSDEDTSEFMKQVDKVEKKTDGM